MTQLAPPAPPSPPALPSPPVTRQRRKETRPQELLDAALDLFVEKGFAATRSEEVAQRAGVSKGTLYLYYPSKEELFKAVVRQKLANLIAEGEGLVNCFDGTASELLGALMQIWWQRVGDTPAAGIHKVMIAEVRNFPELGQFYVDEVIVPADLLLTRAVQRGIDSGEFRQVPVHDVAQALIAPLIFLSLHRHSFGACPIKGPDVNYEDTLRTHLDLVLHGLQVREPAAPVRAGKNKR